MRRPNSTFSTPILGLVRSLAGWLRPWAAIALLAGALAVQTLPQLPPRAFDAGVALLGALLSATRWRAAGLFLLGAAWTAWRADLALSARLAPELEGVELVLEGRVLDLPRVHDDGTQFELAVTQATRDGVALPLAGRVRLAWFDDAPAIEPCTHWRVTAKLKRPRGLVDPGAFDFERYALERGLVATGHVRAAAGNLATARDAWCIDDARRRIVEGITATLGDTPSAHLMRALAFGDQQAMDEHDWAIARATGIPHLIAISGLHIALFAGFGVALVRLAWRLAPPRLTLRWPAPAIEAVAALALALAYAALAGFGLPTRRALVMLAALLLATLARRARAPVHGLALAVVALLAFDPLCVLSAGFWLSFVGVAWLMFCLDGRDLRSRWREALAAQGVASLGLLPLGIWFFGQSSLIGPLANVLAVPVICFCVLPLTVLGACLLPLAAPLGAVLLHVAGTAMAALWWVLQRLAECPGALWYFPEPGICAFVLALCGAFWLLLPRGAPARALGVVLMLPLLLPQRALPPEGAFVVDVLDVGQGLAVLVRTHDHVLLYDAGARYPSGFDLGDAAVVPALHALGITRLDRLIVSHGDNDHAGGAAAVLAAFPGARVVAGEPERLAIAATQCQAGEAWRWDGVEFRIVHPQTPLAGKANDRCCVLDVRTADAELILSGDVSAAVEGDIAAALAPLRPHRVLQVPHHGSKTSSSEAFVRALAPELAPISAGYRNPFHHPHAVVLARYAALGVPTPTTSTAGYLEIEFPPDAAPSLTARGRDVRHPYWRE